MSDGLPSAEYLHECFSVDPERGELYWKERPLSHFKDSLQRSAKWKASFQKSRFAGKPALSVDNGLGYRGGLLDGRKTYAHRVIWKMVNGTDVNCIDHIDGNPRNNSISNLRSVSRRENQQNMKVGKNNSTGVKGVSQHSICGFNAFIADCEGRPLRQWFKSKEEAVAWRSAKEVEFGYMRRGAL